MRNDDDDESQEKENIHEGKIKIYINSLFAINHY